MALVKLVEYADAGPDVRAVYDDIMKTRGTDWVNNFWKALANDPVQLRRIWENVKQVMGPGTALDPLSINSRKYTSHKDYGETDGMIQFAERKIGEGQGDSVRDGPREGLSPSQRSVEDLDVGAGPGECVGGGPGFCEANTTNAPFNSFGLRGNSDGILRLPQGANASGIRHTRNRQHFDNSARNFGPHCMDYISE
jgi:hypothetical protein